MKHVTLDYGVAEPLVLEVGGAALLADCLGPEGLAGAAAEKLVAAAVESPPAGPGLQTHAVPGDRVAIALAGSVPQPAAVLSAVVGKLQAAGVAGDDITLLHAPPLEHLQAEIGRAHV